MHDKTPFAGGLIQDGHRLCWLIMLLLVLVLPLQVQAETGDSIRSTWVDNPGTDLWRDVRQRGPNPAPTSTQVAGVQSGVLINAQGQQWRLFRMELLIPYAGMALAGVIGLAVLFYLAVGRNRLGAGFSGRKVLRYTGYERLLHWSMAVVFIFLALSGLVLLFGRSTLLPWMGPDIFSAIASFSKEGHNIAGPLFAVLLLLMFLKFAARNIYASGDMAWLLRGGGMIGKSHVSAGFFNMGEKSMFWIVVLVGTAMAVSGIVLVWPYFNQGREIMELSHMVHGIAAVVVIAVILGHIYMATLGSEGALEAMSSGYCDINWAKEHHDRWAEVVESEAVGEDELSRR